MTLTKKNYTHISSNVHILALVSKLLEKGDKLVASNEPKGQYVCSCNAGTVQRVK